MKKKKEALAVVVTAALLAALLHGAGWLLLPYADYNGTDWRRYAREPENSVDVLYVGSSLVFCDLDPVGIYGRCGVTGFNVAGPQQSMAISSGLSLLGAVRAPLVLWPALGAAVLPRPAPQPAKHSAAARITRAAILILFSFFLCIPGFIVHPPSDNYWDECAS